MSADAVVRPPQRSEIAAIVEAVNAHSLAVHGVADTSADDVNTWLEAPNLDPERDARVAVLADGRIAGYVDVTDDNLEHRRYWIDLRVRPGYDGSSLLSAAERRVRETAVAGAIVRGFLSGHDETLRSVYESAGYRLVRHSLRMRIDLDGPPASPEWPDGIAVHVFEPGRDDEAVYEAHMEAFADHWDFVPDAFEDWSELLLRSATFDPSLWFLAEAGGEIAGICLCLSERRPNTGHVGILGVRPQWRRRGLGRCLLLHSFRELRQRGREKADLGVDAENLTGAVRLYEQAGMHIAHRTDSYEKRL
jgi:mycothiol synthase